MPGMFMSLLRWTATASVLALATAGGAAAAACPSGATCGTVPVPLDRADPGVGTVGIAYALLPRTDTTQPSLGTIVPNPGGPGESTIGSAQLYTGALTPLRTRRELLLIDVRGTGASGAVACPLTKATISDGPAAVGRVCGAQLGVNAGRYGSADAADDIDAVRAALGLSKLDLWGDSYGTYLMPVYAARHPDHVRSVVLDGAFPAVEDPWGRDILTGTKRVIKLVCARTRRCDGDRVLKQIGTLAARLRAHPRHGITERDLAAVTFGGGDPSVTGALPYAVAQATDHDNYAPLRRLTTADHQQDLQLASIDPHAFSVGGGWATSCHDYARPYDLAAPPATRRAQYARGLRALDARHAFAPFSGSAWLNTNIDAGPKCLDWPADPTAGNPLRGLTLPDVPVLVQSGDLDTNTPVEQGRAAAALWPHPQVAVVANAGHTPDLTPCGVTMAMDFVAHLRTDVNACRHTGTPPHVRR
jgi:pimeloyl-ACP methyl ester carboxylesterase